MSYKQLVGQSVKEIDGITPWIWVKGDYMTDTWPWKQWNETHRDAFMEYVVKRDVVVQAGGNCGLYPRLFSDLFNRVYTFEPDPLCFHCLVNNCQKDNIVKINAALGDENKLVGLERVTMLNTGKNHLIAKGYIPMFTIDQLKLDTCDLIQLDTESTETAILKGARETINSFHPVVTVEHPDRGAWGILMAAGYKCKKQVGADIVFAWEGNV